MIVAMGSWLTANWKVLSVSVTVLLSGAGATVNHVAGADARFDALEIQAVRDSAQMQGIEQDVGEIKCMVVQNAQNEDPLDCLE